MKVLVTGASGFIGKYVVSELLKGSHSIIIAGRTEPVNAGDYSDDRISFLYFDLNKPDPGINYFDYFDRPDAAIHLAWQGLPNYTQLFHFEENLFSHYYFLKNLVTNGLTSLTITGTCFEYGMQEGKLSEDLPANPDNAYALAKYTLYRFLTELKKSTPFNLNWLRLFYMYGEGQNVKSLFSQLNEALGRDEKSFKMSGGEQIRDFLPVETVARNIVNLATRPDETGLINVCSGTPISVKQWVMDYIASKGKEISLELGFYPYATYEAKEFWGDDTRLKKALAAAKSSLKV